MSNKVIKANEKGEKLLIHKEPEQPMKATKYCSLEGNIHLYMTGTRLVTDKVIDIS